MRGLYTNQKRPIEHFGPMLCSCVFSYSYSASRYSYSKRSSIAIRHIGPQVTANRFDQRSASPRFKQPSSTSTVSLSTVRRGGLSTSTTKSDARHERMLCSCKLRLRRDEPDGRLTQRSIELFLASVGFMPAGPRLGATEAMFRVCFFSAARRRKRTTGWGRSHERQPSPSGRQRSF